MLSRRPSRTTWPRSRLSNPSKAARRGLRLVLLLLAADLVDDAAGWIGNAFSDAFDYARKLVRLAVQGVVDWVSAIFNGLDEFAHAIWGTVQSMLNSLSWLLNKAARFVEDVADVAHALYDDAVNWLTSGVRWLADVAIPSAFHAIQDGLNWAAGAINDVSRTVTGWVDQLSSWVAAAVDGARQLATDLANDARNFARSIWDNLVRPALDALNHFWNDYALPLLRLVEKVSGWLAWMAEHPFDWFQKLIGDFVGLRPSDWIAATRQAMGDEGDDIERLIAGWLDSGVA